MMKNFLYPVTWLLTVLHHEILQVRLYRQLFKRNEFFSGLPTLSLGNIQFGGSGKTPLSIAILRDCVKRQVAFIHCTRAYKSKVENSGLILDATQLAEKNITATKVGDEPLLVMQKIQAGTYLLGKNRTRLLKQLSAQVGLKTQFEFLNLEDAFQHIAISRDCDVVLIDTTLAIKEYRLAPLGYLREPLHSLWRADIIILSRWNLIDSAKQKLWLDFVQQYCRKQSKILVMDYHCRGVQAIMGEEKLTLNQLKGKDVVLFSAIASPDSFAKVMQNTGVNILKSYTLSDHATFSAKKLKSIVDHATQNHALLICTEKDAVKIQENSNAATFYCATLETTVQTLDGQQWQPIKDLQEMG